MEKIINIKTNKNNGDMNGANFIGSILNKSKEKKDNNKVNIVNFNKKGNNNKNNNKNKFIYKENVFGSKIAKNNFLMGGNKKQCKKNKKNKKLFNEFTAMKIVEDIFVNRIKNK